MSIQCTCLFVFGPGVGLQNRPTVPSASEQNSMHVTACETHYIPTRTCSYSAYTCTCVSKYFRFIFPSLSCSVHACAAAENSTGSKRVHLPHGQWDNTNHKVSEMGPPNLTPFTNSIPPCLLYIDYKTGNEAQAEKFAGEAPALYGSSMPQSATVLV